MFRKGEKPKASPAGVTLLCSVTNPFRFILIGIIDKYLKITFCSVGQQKTYSEIYTGCAEKT